MILDYTINEVWNLLENIEENQIKETRHFIYSNIKRNYDIGLIYDLILNYMPVQIGKTSLGTYKIVYEHPLQKSKDIYLIIMILNSKEIHLKTIYKANKTRRIREYEPK